MSDPDYYRLLAGRVRCIAQDCGDQRTARRVRLLAKELDDIANAPKPSTYYDLPDMVRRSVTAIRDEHGDFQDCDSRRLQ